jgi:hypothetical protein
MLRVEQGINAPNIDIFGEGFSSFERRMDSSYARVSGVEEGYVLRFFCA